MDIQVTAAAALALLGPYLAKAGGSLAEKIGDAMYTQMQTVYTAIKEKFKGDQTAEKALTLAAQEPEKKAWHDTLLGILIIKMEEDPAFADAIQQLVKTGEKSPEGDRIEQKMDISGKTGDVFQVGKMGSNISKTQK